MTTIEQKVDALCRMLLSATEEDRAAARIDLNSLLQQKPKAKTMEGVIHDVLTDLGVPCQNAGYAYLVSAIGICASDISAANHLHYGLYSKVAAKFDSTSQRIERSIRHCVDVTFRQGDPDILYKYFGNTISAERGKPTNGQFITRIANVVRLMLQD